MFKHWNNNVTAKLKHGYRNDESVQKQRYSNDYSMKTLNKNLYIVFVCAGIQQIPWKLGQNAD